MIHRLIVPLTLAVPVARADPVLAQGNGGQRVHHFPRAAPRRLPVPAAG